GLVVHRPQGAAWMDSPARRRSRLFPKNGAALGRIAKGRLERRPGRGARRFVRPAAALGSRRPEFQALEGPEREKSFPGLKIHHVCYRHLSRTDRGAQGFPADTRGLDGCETGADGSMRTSSSRALWDVQARATFLRSGGAGENFFRIFLLPNRA